MGTVIRLPQGKYKEFDDNGDPLAGGKLYTYEPNTTSNKATYQDADGSTPHANPIILDSRGEATIFWDGNYDVKVTDSTDVLIRTDEDVGQATLEDEQRTAPQAVTHNMASDANYALLSAQEGYGRIIITDTTAVLTATRSIICSDTERGYYFQNDTLQTLTLKTSAGTGIAVPAGEATYLVCDGTNVVDPLTSVWGTNDLEDNAVTPAKLSTGQYGGDYIKLTDTKATTVDGGASVAGIQTRDLNTEDHDTGNHCDIAYWLPYDAQTADFTVSTDSTPITLTGGTSNATAKLVADVDGGATGTAYVVNISGTFQDNEIITDGVGGSATSNIPSGVSAKAFYLSAGTYRIEVSAPVIAVNRNKLFLYNVSDAGNESIGTAEYADSTNVGTEKAIVKDEFEIASSKVFEIRHYTQTVSGTGLGTSTDDGTSEIYTIVELHKVK